MTLGNLVAMFIVTGIVTWVLFLLGGMTSAGEACAIWAVAMMIGFVDLRARAWRLRR